MARLRSVDLLPEIFRTETNKKFLSATLDQLVQEPKLRRTQGYIGRRTGTADTDRYVAEPNDTRRNYQLEPAVVLKDPGTGEINDAITYPGMVDALANKNSFVNNHNRLWKSENYVWDPQIDLDKFVNFGEYYWLPQGPDPVDVSSNLIPLTEDYTVTRAVNGFNFTTEQNVNPVITVARGGVYTFAVDGDSQFWIQSNPGVTGQLDTAENRSAREVVGVFNNGETTGTVTFAVPEKNAQEFYYNLTDGGLVDLATTLKFNEINNQYVNEFATIGAGVDDLIDLEGRTIILLAPDIDAQDGGWVKESRFDADNFDTVDYADAEYITDQDQRYGIWRIEYELDDDGAEFIQLKFIRTVAEHEKVKIEFGSVQSGYSYFRNSSGLWERVPELTAAADTLYYQDSEDPNFFGEIRIVDQDGVEDLDIDNILSRSNYISPNGVEFTNGLKVRFRGTTTPARYEDNTYYVEGVGTAIKLTATDDTITPETYIDSVSEPYDYIGYDAGGYDNTLSAPVEQDYVTINRADISLNPWSRSNRWFHSDVINKTAEYNNSVAVFDQDSRAVRPIVEFEANLRLFNFGTEAIEAIDIIDLNQIDALSNVHGKTGYSIDGYSLIDGSRIIFAADTDDEVRNKVYEVQYIDPEDDGDAIIHLVLANDGNVQTDNTVVVKSGVSLQGKTYRYTGTEWIEAQTKTQVNQGPLFDIFDVSNNSLSNTNSYSSSTFTGSKLFGYKVGTGTPDSVLDFPLSYANINNVGDIVFDNFLYNDTFLYVSGGASVSQNISIGHVRKYSSRTSYEKKIGWTTSNTDTQSRQVFEFEHTNTDLVIDVIPTVNTTRNTLKVYSDDDFVPSTYYTTTENTERRQTTISFTDTTYDNSLIRIEVESVDISDTGYWSLPKNLEKNPGNENSENFTLGSIRKHYQSICENIATFSGKINGSNNIRDLSNVISFGESIVQQSSPLNLTGALLRNKNLDIDNAIQYNAREYEKFKSILLDTVAKQDVWDKRTDQILDEALNTMNANKSVDGAFYWSDMLPGSGNYTETSYTYTAISTNNFDLTQTYDFTSANYKALLIYVNDVLLREEHEYVVATDGPRVTIGGEDNFTLGVGDKIRIREYTTTVGSYCPATPSKLGLYPAGYPELITDDTYVTTQSVIRGHDGSITVAFGDFRDDVLLEFEKRIYNNIKVADRYNSPLDEHDLIPGFWRTTDYSLENINTILGQDFLSWVGFNRLDYKTQTYDSNNQFTYNYSTSGNKFDNQPLLGHWRGIYRYFYDTETPHTTPWEMLGFAERPDWWISVYGPAPWTNGNQVLWEDLEAGRVADPSTDPYILSNYARPGLTSVIPVDSEGNLRGPMDAGLVKDFDPVQFEKSWVVGDGAPVEEAWKRSSSYPFALMRLMLLTQPAKFTALNIDIDKYKYNTDYSQYLYDNRYRLDIGNFEIYGGGTIKHSYFNWLVEYNKQFGIDTATILGNTMDGVDVQLAYRMAGFSDKKFLKVLIEKSSPGSENTSLLVPDESFEVKLYKNQPTDRLTWSSVVIQKVSGGWSVNGYSRTKPYFEIVQTIRNGNYETINFLGTEYRFNKDFYQDKIVRVPYGYTFSSKEGVLDFLNSYGKRLTQQGMIFDSYVDGYIFNWNHMAAEFLNWANQGFANGAIVNLNPGAREIRISRTNQIADTINQSITDTQVINQNNDIVSNSNLDIYRLDNDFVVRTTNDDVINYMAVDFTSYEHIIIFDNSTVFNDLIYDPIEGVRQSRININGFRTYEWDGTLDAQGFMLNQDNVGEWSANKKYSKGEYVKYKNAYWSARQVVEPTEEFEFDKWIKSDYEKINKGLLPNLATKSEQLITAYDANSANLENDSDLFGFGITGFRPRQYMQNINLDDVSQVNVYKSFLGTKGTSQATELFNDVTVNNERVNYEIFENWAVKRGQYGATSNRNYVELSLNDNVSQANPGIIEVTTPGDTSIADQTVLYTNVYKTSKFLNNDIIFPTTTETVTDVNIPTAGYVNSDDVDFQVFDIESLTSLNEQLDDIRAHTSVWVAKDNSYDWNVYCVRGTNNQVVSMKDNLDSRTIVNFKNPHSLTVGKVFVVKNFNDVLDGAYRVSQIRGLSSVIIDLEYPLNNDTTGTGTFLSLDSVRVEQPSDIADLEIESGLITGSRVWIDNNGSGKWAVLEKTQPFTLNTTNELVPATPAASQEFGSSVAQGFDNQIAIIGAPGSGESSGRGALYGYAKGASGVYGLLNTISPDVTGLVGLGNSVDIGYQNWIVAGASGSDSGRGYALLMYWNPSTQAFVPWQWLLPDSGVGTNNEWGYDVAISADERWAYVGEPGRNRVHAYGRVDVEDQEVQFISDGQTWQFNIENIIEVDTADQLIVQYDSTPTTSFTLAGSIVSLVGGSPDAGVVIKITRRTGLSYTGDGSTTDFAIDDIYTVDSGDIETFRVTVAGELQRPGYDYTLSGTTITFSSAPATDVSIAITNSTAYWKKVAEINPGVSGRFGHSVACTTDGRQVIIGEPQATADSETNSGVVHVYDRTVERFVVDSTTATSGTLTVQRTPDEVVAVKSNRSFLTNTEDNATGEYTVSGTTITLDPKPSVGDEIEVETNTFLLIQTIGANTEVEGAQFGRAVDQCSTGCSVYVGAPYDGTAAPLSGSVHRWVNNPRLYGTLTGTESSPTVTAGHSIRINNHEVVFTGTTLSSVVDDIVDADIPNVTATTSSNKLVISLINADAALPTEKLLLLPGLGTGYTDLGLAIYGHTQTFYQPIPESNALFGSSLEIDSGAYNLIVGAPNASGRYRLTIDESQTVVDSGSTDFRDIRDRSGSVYTFNLLLSANSSASNPAKFVFGQELLVEEVDSYDGYGTAVSYVSEQLLITAPSRTNSSLANVGETYEFNNSTKQTAWQEIRTERAVVDTDLVNSVFIYNKTTKNVEQYLDFIDPIRGKILGTVQQDLDYIMFDDPAGYNNGNVNNYGTPWRESHVGNIWWNLNRARLIDYNQSSIDYAAKRIGNLFEGSTVDVYQWIESDVPPASYTGPGTTYGTTRYTSVQVVDDQGLLQTKYYFWVTGLDTVATGKKLTLNIIKQYLENPKSSGIPYAAIIDASTVALYNVGSVITDSDSVLHVEYDSKKNSDNVHAEYEIISEENGDSFLATELFNKMVDSFAGTDRIGRPVPDPALSIADTYGVDIRPRQTMFEDRGKALENYINRVNRKCALYPLRETRSFPTLFAQDPEPGTASGLWDTRVADNVELSYQNLDLVSAGHRYLIQSDANNNGLWAIYVLNEDQSFSLQRVQTYDTSKYWEYTTWYKPGFDSLTTPTAEVQLYSNLSTLEADEGSVVRVATNSSGLSELYQLIDGEWVRQSLENGTIKFLTTIHDYDEGRFGFDQEVFDTQYYDQAPQVETRKIIESINNEIFIDDLIEIRNELLILTFEYITAEQETTDWLFKTSLIDVTNRIRDLVPLKVYQQDNQEFIESYINEVKPLHVKIKEFKLQYDALDTNRGYNTDFDVPIVYDSDSAKFVSAILDDGEAPIDSVSSKPSTDTIWTSGTGLDWYNNYTLTLEDVTVTEGGSGYTATPNVEVSGTYTEAPVLRALINSQGEVYDIEVVSAGSGYATTPTITITGGNGTGATVTPVMEQATVRTINTILKYDRVKYSSAVVDWTANSTFDVGQLVRYQNKVYRAFVDDSSLTVTTGTTLSTEQFELVEPADLDAIDRVQGLYQPTINSVGLDLGLLIEGITYPGVELQGPLFSQNSGFDVGNFDINIFDNFEIGDEGLPTYSEEILDAIYSSAFTDTYLGTRSTDINVDGAGFVDVYNSHAPEELVPGATFDTLDMKVFTRPGYDYSEDGHGFKWSNVTHVYDGSTTTYSYAGLTEYPAVVIVSNATTGKVLTTTIDFTVDYVNQTITLVQGVSTNDKIYIEVVEVGGGNQLYKEVFSETNTNSIDVPVAYDEVSDVVVAYQGLVLSGVTFSEKNDNETTVQLPITLDSGKSITLVVLGDTVDYSWSMPVGELHVGDGSTTTFTLAGGELDQTNKNNAIIFNEGQRLRPPESREHFYDGSDIDFLLPETSDLDQDLVQIAEVTVKWGDTYLSPGIDFELTQFPGEDRYNASLLPQFTNDPDNLVTGTQVIVTVWTAADYVFNGADLYIKSTAPVDGAHVLVTSFNDTRQQNLLTQVFVGTTSISSLAVEPFDNVNFDEGNGFDYSDTVTVSKAEFDTGRTITDSRRLFVTKNGLRQIGGVDWTTDGSKVVMFGTFLETDRVVVTNFTQDIVPDDMNFRIFHDMLDARGMYRIYEDNQSTITEVLEVGGDVITVADATKFGDPDLANNNYGVVMLNGERITYKTRNTTNNTLSGLRRGTAGTAIARHLVGETIYDINPGEKLPAQYQDKLEKYIGTGDGATTKYTTEIVIGSGDSTVFLDAIQVYIGGTLQTSGYEVTETDPVAVIFDEAPDSGVQVLIYVRQALSLYEDQSGTALQELDNSATRFLNE